MELGSRDGDHAKNKPELDRNPAIDSGCVIGVARVTILEGDPQFPVLFRLRAESSRINLGPEADVRFVLDRQFLASDMSTGELTCSVNAGWEGAPFGPGDHQILVEVPDFGRVIEFTADGSLLFCGFPSCDVVFQPIDS